MMDIVGIFGSYTLDMEQLLSVVRQIFLTGLAGSILITFTPTALLLVVRGLFHMMGRS